MRALRQASLFLGRHCHHDQILAGAMRAPMSPAIRRAPRMQNNGTGNSRRSLIARLLDETGHPIQFRVRQRCHNCIAHTVGDPGAAIYHPFPHVGG